MVESADVRPRQEGVTPSDYGDPHVFSKIGSFLLLSDLLRGR